MTGAAPSCPGGRRPWRHAEAPPPRLIVNADDLGLSEPVNSGILDAHRTGIVTAASLMANGPAFDHAVALCRAHPGLDLGIHLSLVGECPVSPPHQVPSLVTRDGRLHDNAFAFTGHYLRGRIDAGHLARELDAQIQRVRDTGLRISHLDSHQHLHMLPAVWEIVAGLAIRHGIPAARRAAERPAPYMATDPRRWPRLAQLLVLSGLGRRIRRAPLVQPDHFVGFFFGGRLGLRRLLGLIERLPDRGVTELMCHPGRPDPASPYAHWRYGWLEELAALTSPRVRAALESRGIALARFSDLTPRVPPRDGAMAARPPPGDFPDGRAPGTPAMIPVCTPNQPSRALGTRPDAADRGP